MNLLREPPPQKLIKFLQKDDLQGKTILHYTGTMFGIGCRLSSGNAIERIVKLKQRKENSGLIVLVPDLNWFDDAGISLPKSLKGLMGQYWPGNLTFVTECADQRFEKVELGGKVAFRVPQDSMLRFFIEQLGEPMISTSINVSTLPPENDLNRISKSYDSWFDFGLVPMMRNVDPEPKPSTVVEFIPAEKSDSMTDEIKCLREGSVPFYSIKESFHAPLIMFVCTANICRSPIADKLFNHLVKERGMNFRGDSCGLIQGGSMISINSMQLLMERGILDAQSHVSKKITSDLISAGRWVLTMEERQRDILRDWEPNSAHKIMTLNEIVGESGDIKDPYGSELDNYRGTFDLIEDRILRLIDLLSANKI
ncbi:MAG: Sua5/YciO/YrdC/YwlC family protein [Candidatus Cloacimonadaceae bacterium]|nr:Sua5/YciO/YrdC/YwlC family protein [Candidatus Cloacimonadaceae bacterium]